MATAVVSPDVEVAVRPASSIPTAEGFWARVGTRLSNWGQKIKAGLKRVGNWFVRALQWSRDKIVSGAKWVWNLAPVRWTVAQARSFGGWLRHGVWRGPVPWVLGGGVVGAVMPPLFMIGAMTAVTAALVILFWRARRPVALASPATEGRLSIPTQGESYESTLDIDLSSDETIESRYEYLESLQNTASAEEDVDLFSDLTGRLFLLQVRSGNGGKVTKNASVPDIYRACKASALRTEPNEEMWSLSAMRQGVEREAQRLKDVAQLKAALISAK